ncbi:CYTH domain protein [Lactobacillus selangorensis]|uniref:CYTH domain protein n=1 Tax=Lactobacillus selangorensis TaxID=81857 RepID=A0A0R2FIE9_9LACO|nr:CYTH domain-containing protein [Lactobacillus selangorensis]KRN28441.1 CYTH domain protein [Lactobacillus selangorensis]KRN31942.1 CYTH domain protein [Lactobacillus selangorensis]
MQSTEREFKNLLTAAQFQAVRQAYPFQAPFQQQNNYFDTANQALVQHHWGLRIRLFADHAEQTLKTPQSGPGRTLLETTDPLSVPQAQQLVRRQQILAPSQVATKLATIDVQPHQLRLIGQATTTRYLCSLPEGLLTLDQTDYPDGDADYELEMEVHDFQNETLAFQTILKKFQIAKQPIINKVQRAIQHKS